MNALGKVESTPTWHVHGLTLTCTYPPSVCSRHWSRSSRNLLSKRQPHAAAAASARGKAPSQEGRELPIAAQLCGPAEDECRPCRLDWSWQVPERLHGQPAGAGSAWAQVSVPAVGIGEGIP